jgi:hypothetical protein
LLHSGAHNESFMTTIGCPLRSPNSLFLGTGWLTG